MLRRFLHRQHRSEAGVAALQNFAPLIAASRDEDCRKRGAHFRPQTALVLGIREALGQADALREFGEELRLDRGDCNVLGVGGFIRVVVRRAAVEQVLAARPTPGAACRQAIEDRHQRIRAVDHRGVDHLTAPRGLALVQRSEHAQRQVQRAAAVVAHQVQRRHRLAAARADRVQRTAQRDVVQVVAGGHRERAGLAKACHAAIHQRRVQRVAGLRPDPQALGDTGAKAFEQHVGARDQAQRGVAAGRGLQVERDRAAIPRIDGEAPVHRDAQATGFAPVDAHDIGAEVGEQHGAHRHRADALEFDDAQSVQWAHGVSRGRFMYLGRFSACDTGSRGAMVATLLPRGVPGRALSTSGSPRVRNAWVKGRRRICFRNPAANSITTSRRCWSVPIFTSCSTVSDVRVGCEPGENRIHRPTLRPFRRMRHRSQTSGSRLNVAVSS